MRLRRVIGTGASCYHVMSRVIERQFILGDKEKRKFMEVLRQESAFSGVQVLTYCLMDDHFHILLEVPERPEEMTDEELAKRMQFLYGTEFAGLWLSELQQARELGIDENVATMRKRVLSRIFDLSVFMQEVKQRFTQWYNRRNGRRGTLWEDRFKSVLVESNADALYAMSVYIDLNPVRAGISADPKDYRWCGYGAAIGGDALAQSGLCRVIELMYEQASTWKKDAALYRTWLFGAAHSRKDALTEQEYRKGIDPEKIAQVLERGGKLSLAQMLRCKVRYFTDGVVLGSQIYVDETFERYKDHFSEKRSNGGRRLKHGEWGTLRCMRDLRLSAVSPCG